MGKKIVADESLQTVNLQDRRSIRSRKMIYNALIDLIEEKGLDGFTVSDITERADLNRSTFYSHFKDRDHLIRCFEDDFFAGLGDIEAMIAEVTPEELVDASIGERPLECLVKLFDYLRENSDLLLALIGPSGDIRFEHMIIDNLCVSIVDKILNHKYKDNPTRLVKYYTAFIASASLGIVRMWLEDNMVESSEEMARIMFGLAELRPGEPIEIDGLKGE